MKNKFYVLLITLLILFGIGGCKNKEQSPPVTSEKSLSPTPTVASEKSLSPTPTVASEKSLSPTPSVTTEKSLTPTPTDPSPMSAYQSVLQNKTQFFSVDANKDLNISQLNLVVSEDSSVKSKATKFAIVDLDNDGIPEVILWLAVNNNDDFGFEVLRHQDGVVYGYTLSYRSFMDLKEDGTFSFSSGAADFGFGTLEFKEKVYTVDMISYSESSYDSNNNQIISYFVNHESATEEEFLSAFNTQSEKTGATWYDFTDENIDKLFSDFK